MMVWQGLPDEGIPAMAAVLRLAHRPSVVQWGLSAQDGESPVEQAAREVRTAELLRGLGDTRCFVGVTPSGSAPYPSWEDLGQRRCFNVGGPLWYPGPERMPRYGNDDDAVLRVTRCAALLAPDKLTLPWPREGPAWAERGGPVTSVERAEAVEWFGRDVARTLEQASLLSRYLQAEMLRYLAQRARRRGVGGFFAGSVGQAEECFASDAIVECDGAKRPAYHALRAAYAPVCACAVLDRSAYWVGMTLDVGVQLLVDREEEEEEEEEDGDRMLTVTGMLYGADGAVLAEDIWESPCQRRDVGRMRVLLPETPGALLLRMETYREGRRMAREDVTLCVGVRALQEALTRLPQTTLTLAEGVLTNAGEATAVGVACDGYLKEGIPGWGCLLPGESVPVREGAAVEGLNVRLVRGTA
jgi:hypothetical protein